MYTGTCRKRELQPASLQGHTSQDEQCLQVMGHFMLDRLPEMLPVLPVSLVDIYVPGDGAEVKHIRMIGSKPNTLCHARAEIPCFMPAVERLTVESICEKVKTPIMSSKFLLLKYLDIFLVDVQLYRQDYFSLVSFLEASPALETFMLRVETGYVLRSDSVLKDLDKDQLHLRQMPECLHYNLKNVMMTGFSSAKSLIELTSHIVRNASALVCMTLDTAWGCGRRTTKTDKCEHMSKEGLMEAQRALEAVNRCIEGIVPSSTNFKALEPCCQCGG
ncbi:uncharacterized protein LOC101786677 isoform X5 [Setaria italica]|uniref:uncharacterized protein LOC101786677 isoform X5 n=1 Tax=Setaria italica TaxID=4555 RepID=UPI000BE5C510|nr:uncharacterized protein LOC101786677 isoform X5 [Setaria italica]